MSEPHTENHYEGPVFHGNVSGGQFAWQNEQVEQHQENTTAAAPGHEELAELLRQLLRQLPAAGLPAQEQEDVEAAAREALETVTGTEAPEPGRLRRRLAALRGVLGPVAEGAVAGAAAGAEGWARAAVRALTGIG